MIQSISVNGEVHQIDYTTLANKPTIPSADDLLPSVTQADSGKVLAVNSNGEWAPALSVNELLSAITDLQNRLTELENNGSGTVTPSTQKTVSGSKLSLSGSTVSTSGEKLQVTGSEFSVSGEKLSIS